MNVDREDDELISDGVAPAHGATENTGVPAQGAELEFWEKMDALIRRHIYST